MIIVGLLLLVLGLALSSNILWLVGLVLIVVGAAIWILGSMNNAFAGGRRFY